MQYFDDGYLPEAVINYLRASGLEPRRRRDLLARATRRVFDLDHITPSRRSSTPKS